MSEYDVNNKVEENDDDEYEKICYICRRPESKCGKLISLPGNMDICPDCMQRSFDTINGNINMDDIFKNGNMLGISFLNLSDIGDEIPKNQKIKKKKNNDKYNTCFIPLSENKNNLTKEKCKCNPMYKKGKIHINIHSRELSCNSNYMHSRRDPL